jgi:chorismate mutase
MPAFLLPMLLKGFGFVKEAIKAVIGFIAKHPWQSASLALLVACAWLWRANNGLEDAIKAERAAHVQTVANFKKAQADAEAVQAHNLARVKQAQEEVTDETVKDYRADAADWKSRFDRLRKANRGASCETVLPAVPDTASGVDGTNPDTSVVAVKIDDLETLVQNSVRGKALQDWVERQAAVETSPGDE